MPTMVECGNSRSRELFDEIGNRELWKIVEEDNGMTKIWLGRFL